MPPFGNGRQNVPRTFQRSPNMCSGSKPQNTRVTCRRVYCKERTRCPASSLFSGRAPRFLPPPPTLHFNATGEGTSGKQLITLLQLFFLKLLLFPHSRVFVKACTVLFTTAPPAVSSPGPGLLLPYFSCVVLTEPRILPSHHTHHPQRKDDVLLLNVYSTESKPEILKCRRVSSPL